MQEPQSFGHHFIGKEINASGIAARPGEVDDKTKLNRVFTDTEDDRDACCRSFGCKRGCCANRGDHGHLSADQIGHQCRQAIVLGLQPVVLDRHVLAFDVAGFVEALAKRGHVARVGIGRPVSDKPDHGHRRLLRARRERPRSRAASQYDEIASPHGSYPKAKDRELKYSRSGLCSAAKPARSCPLWVMCGRRLIDKSFLTLMQYWSGAVMCPAC